MKKILPFILLCFLPSFGALNLMTWDGSASSDFNDTANWTGTCASGNTLSAGDSCLMNTGSTAATVSASVAIGALMVTAGYTGTISLQTYTLTVSGAVVNLGGATLSAGTSTLSLTGAAAQTITSQGEVWYDITINRSTAGTCLFADATSCHTLTASATNTQVISWTGTTMTCSGDMLLDGSGTHVLGNGITMTGASSTLHIGSTLTAPTATSCAVTMNTNTAGVIDDDKGTTFKSLTLGASAVVTNSGSQVSSYTSSTPPLTFTNGGTFTCNQGINISLTSDGALYSITGSPSISTAVNKNIQIFVAANNVDGTAGGLTVTGSGGLFYGVSNNSTGTTITFTGNVSVPILYLGQTSSSSVLSYSLGGYTFTTSSDFYFGMTSGTTYTINFDSSIINAGSVNSTSITLAGTNNVNFNKSKWSVSGNTLLYSGYTLNPGSSIVRLTPGAAGTATVTSNGKHFAWFRLIGNTTSKTTLADSLYADSAFTDSTGKFNQAGKTIYCRDWFNYSPDSTWLNGVKYITRNFTRGTAATIVNTDTAMTRFIDGGAGVSDTHTINAPVNKLGMHRMMHRGGTYLLADSAYLTRLIVDTGRVLAGTKVLRVDSLKIKDTGCVFATLRVDVWDSVFKSITMGSGFIKKHNIGASITHTFSDTSQIDTMTAVDSVAFVLAATKGMRFLTIDSATLSGAAGKLNYFSSGTPGSQARLWIPGNRNQTYGYWKDIYANGGTILDTVGGSNGGNNTNIRFFNLSFAYAGSPQIDTVGKAIAALDPTLPGSTPDSIVAITTLPAGLSIAKTGANIGRITGTPTTASGATAYTIRAYGSNKTDSASTTVTITVLNPARHRRSGLTGFVIGIVVGDR